ncbi:Exocyst complex component SEC15A [Bienertia sinuspersici]
MNAKTKKRTVAENDGDTGTGEDLLKNLSKKKETEIEELCRLHYEEFIIAVDELRGVLVDAEELKAELAD